MPSAVELLNYRSTEKLYNVQCTCTFVDFPPKLGFIAVFFLYIVNIAKISEAAMGGAGGAQRPVLPVYVPKKTSAHRAWASMRGQNSLVEK